MYFIYFLRSIEHPNQTYIGFTSDLERRLRQHNDGESTHTNKFRPWNVETYVMADTRETAEGVERYFKSNAGKERIQRYVDQNPDERTIVTFFEELSEGEKFARSRFEAYKKNKITFQRTIEDEVI